MSSLNKAIIIGNVGADPNISTMPSGDRVANFRVATSEIWRDKATGEKKERTEWHTVAVFVNTLVDVIEKYVAKGSKIAVEGVLQTHKWTDKDGNERYTTQIAVRPFGGSLVLLGGDRPGHASEGRQERRDEPQRDEPQRSAADELDDDLPW